MTRDGRGGKLAANLSGRCSFSMRLAFAAIVKADLAKWRKVVAEANVKVD